MTNEPSFEARSDKVWIIDAEHDQIFRCGCICATTSINLEPHLGRAVDPEVV
jgi:hypothetical protein